MNGTSQTYIIGVDGGGTGCRAAIGTASAGILAMAQGGRANVSSDPDEAIRNVTAAISSAASSINIDKVALSGAVAHLGLAGVMSAADSQRVASAFPFKLTIVTDDKPTAVVGALGGQDGFLVSLGTGSILAASHGDKFRSVGGWGLQISDHGSGAWLGRAILEQTMLCFDGVTPHSDLTQAILADFDQDPNAIVAFSITAKPGDFATLAPMVLEAADAGDAVGVMLMRQGALHIAQGLRALGFQSGDRLCITGGVGPFYVGFLTPDILSGQVKASGTALDGAFHLARSLMQPSGE